MNITIKLTTKEVLELARKAIGDLGFPGTHLEIVIDDSDHPVSRLIRDIVREFPGYQYHQKIAAIRALRDRGTSSVFPLRQAKWAIENPEAAIKHLNEHGYIPEPV